MIKIDNHFIEKSCKPYLIAELSANHGGSIETAKNTILAAKNAGANAVKLQTYTPDTMTIDFKGKQFKIDEGLWKGKYLYDLYKEAHTPFDWHKPLFDYAKKIGITIFSTPFDETAVDLLEDIATPAYKIASFELRDIPLIKKVAACKKPLFMSTGMGTLEEIGEAVDAAKSMGNEAIILLHCISSYPAATQNSHLNNIKTLSREFNLKVGLSDHTLDNTASIISIGLGAVVIEKHFKIDDRDTGPDSSFSLTPDKFISLRSSIDLAHLAIGSDEFQRSEQEITNMKFRRSLYFVTDMKKGQRVTNSDIKRIRPGYGLAPKFFDEIIGKHVKRTIKRGEPVKWVDFF